ncbi:type I-A CRISPR-associated protein Cas7/Csa2 [Saccharolobus islandicus]|uniref:CRISPR-associated autoregulator, DevR family n=2 Tax=Saccharolobus islandicus TaxID=43080 RepID=C3MX16_SACI4|nr:type I-A CRISPR-associated protein Cas7/Csa2 [Sulfolobus islandicus]ACP37696.1 CRISPR-associated autoregulator, DevR family [Sulfolobus islandicus M.14.25]ACP54892.1 CRISPR-associated autoregulator, DevR family [Sulfolobus islandicus M.16.27]
MISGSGRFLVNLESLNGVESIGNLTKHRTAPVVLKTSTGYLVRYVPVISGEALAHAYQASLVDIAKKEGLPVGNLSSQYEFIKFSTDEALKIEGIKEPKDYNDARRFEVEVMLKDTIADVGGFMYAGNAPVRRTSRIKLGYMIPALRGDEIPAQLEAQFHVRFSNKPVSGSQAIFNVEVSSALYTFSFELDEDLIAVPSTVGEKVKGEEELERQKARRVDSAIKALYSLLAGNFGGKRSRFLPSMKLMSLVVTKTDFPFIPEPGHDDSYIKTTVMRLEKAKSVLNGNVAKVYVINNEGIEVGEGATVLSSVEDLVFKLKEK